MKLPATFSAVFGDATLTLTGTVSLPDEVSIPAAPSPTQAPTPAPTPIPAAPSNLALPARMMTDAWPLNKPATIYPDETRLLKCNNGDGQFAPRPIVDNFLATFGPNYIHLDTSMPWNVVDSKANPDVFVPVRLTTDYTAAYDASKVPIKGCKIEGGADAAPDTDRHILAYDVATGILHETWLTHVATDGSYDAAAYVPFDTTKPVVLPNGQTSADAAGLPILPLLCRYEEALAGVIKHALRGTINLSRTGANGSAFCSPASHGAGSNWGSPCYMGMRLRLRSDFPVAGLSGVPLNLVLTLQQYGIVLADNGGSGYLTCDDDPRWTGALEAFSAAHMKLSDFIPINSGPIIDSTGQAVQ